MAWNPSPKVADCRDIAAKWRKEQIIIIGIDSAGACEIATFGKTRELCACAQVFGDAAFAAIKQKVVDIEAQLRERK